MNLYYAPGGGMAHFSRAIAFIHSHPGLSIEDTVVMVADRDMYALERSCFADKVWQHLKLVKIPKPLFSKRASLVRWLEEWLKKHRPSHIYLDTFPAGIVAEWSALGYEGIFFYVGRYLNWVAYPHPLTIHFKLPSAWKTGTTGRSRRYAQTVMICEISVSNILKQ